MQIALRQLCAGVLACCVLPAADWLTYGGDAERSNWLKGETEITKRTVAGLKLDWKLALDNKTKELHSLLQPIVLGRVITDHGFKELAYVAGSDDNIFAVDVDTGKVFWKRHFEYDAPIPQEELLSQRPKNWLCPGGLTAIPAIPRFFARRPAVLTASSAPGVLTGLGAPETATPTPTSGLGPQAPTTTATTTQGAAPTTPPAAAVTTPPGAAAPAPNAPGRPNGGAFPVRSIYIVSSDGKLHALNVATGESTGPALPFVPPHSKPWSLSIEDNVVYTATSQHCGGSPNAVYALDLSSPDKKVAKFASGGGGIWGRGGVAIDREKNVFVEVGDGQWDPDAGKYSDSFLELSPKDLSLKDYYTPMNREWITKKDLDMGNTTPVIFVYKGRELMVGAGKEGVLYLLDTKSLGGDTHRKPLYRSPLLTNDDVDFAGRGFWGSFATYEDAKGTRWVYAPAWGPPGAATNFPVKNGDAPNGSIMAFKVEDGPDGQPTLVPAWISRDMNVPEPPVVVNGIVFAISSGEFVRQARVSEGGLWTSQQRAEKSKPAVIYAFDAETGAELWSSGNTITSFTHFGGLTIVNGRIYIATYDNTLYAFGLKKSWE
jgi:outer membrane protein assembly factor BamB